MCIDVYIYIYLCISIYLCILAGAWIDVAMVPLIPFENVFETNACSHEPEFRDISVPCFGSP